jgi:hypothetical protein
MLIERERYLDDGPDWHLSIALQSRSPQMHSLLTALTIEERAAVSDLLGRALDDITGFLRQRMPAHTKASS